MTGFRAILKRYWGYDDFRPLQLDIIESVGNGHDTLALMPTGGGKSITFQVPALATEGVCLVVTPLIALMKDQVENLNARGLRSAAVYSGLPYRDIQTILDNCAYGLYKFLYVSPERLGTRAFAEKARSFNVNLIAVDEAHCISQWGYDFRPAYLKISDLRQLFPGVPVLALTATATPPVVDDIQEKLAFSAKNVFRKSFRRDNLAYIVRRAEDKMSQTLAILRGVPGTSVIYVRNRKKTKEISDLLNQAGISADYFHAGLSNSVKDRRQKRWKEGECRVIVATNAFGMGIDKPDVRTVIHLDFPDSLEAYFQEAGRAGRDGLKAYAVLLYNNTDLTKMKKRLADEFPPKEDIIRAYEEVSNFLNVPSECMEGAMFDFSLERFCQAFHRPVLPTHSALKILALSGYIEYTDELEMSSRVLFVTGRDELYRVPMSDSANRVTSALLRSYTGLFTDYAFINEETLAQRAGLTAQAVRDELINLSRMRVINYIPYKKSPFIIYTRPRVETRLVRVSKAAYDDRRARYAERLKRMTAYATTEGVCRSRMLLDYFGEKTDEDCGVCDVCLAARKRADSPVFLRSLADRLRAGDDTPRAIAAAMRLPETQVVRGLRYLLDQGVAETADSHTFHLTENPKNNCHGL